MTMTVVECSWFHFYHVLAYNTRKSIPPGLKGDNLQLQKYENLKRTDELRPESTIEGSSGGRVICITPRVWSLFPAQSGHRQAASPQPSIFAASR